MLPPIYVNTHVHKWSIMHLSTSYLKHVSYSTKFNYYILLQCPINFERERSHLQLYSVLKTPLLYDLQYPFYIYMVFGLRYKIFFRMFTPKEYHIHIKLIHFPKESMICQLLSFVMGKMTMYENVLNYNLISTF